MTHDLPAWRAFTGQSVEAVQGLGWLDAVHPDEREWVRADWERAVATRRPYSRVCRVRRADGVYRALSLHLLPQFDARGRLRQWDGSCIDVSTRTAYEQEREEQLARAVAAHHAEQIAKTLQREQAANQELRRLQALTDTALSHLGLADLLPALLDRIQTVMRVEDVGILLLDAEGQHLTLRAARGLEDAVAARANIPVGRGIAGRVAATRQPLVIDDLATFDVFYPQLRETEQSAMCVPLVVEGRLLGVVYVGSAAPRHFTQADVQLLERAADRMALAIDRAQLLEHEQAARRAAEQESARWQTAMESVPELIVTCDADRRVTYVNPAYERLRGSLADRSVPVEQRPARYGLLLPDGTGYFPVEQLPLTRAIREGRPVSSVEMLFRIPDGEERLVVWEAAPMRTTQGELLGAIAIGRDITERRQAEEALQASEARYRDLVETQTELICRYRPDGTLTFVNDAYCRHFGRSREALLGTRFPELLPPAQAERARRGLTEFMWQPSVVTDEHAVVRPDGTLGWQQWVEHPITDPEGHIIEIQAIGRDITERKQAEEALRASEARFRAAFESAATGMLLVDTSGRALLVNQPLTAMLGYSADELRAQTFMDLTYPDDLEPNQTLFRRALAGEIDHYQLEKRYRHKDGHLVWGRLSAGVVRDATGQALYLVGQIEDITERKRLERERAEQAEQLDRIVEGMAEGLVVWDAEGHIVRTNAAQRRITGMDVAPPDFIRMPVAERVGLYALRDQQGHPLAPQDTPVMRALRGEVLTGADAPDVRMRTPDGREIELTISVAPLRDREGHITGAVGIYRDQTERNRLEREHIEQAAQLEATFEAMADALVIYDAEGRTVHTNSAARRLLGLEMAPPDYYQLASHERVPLYLMRDAQDRPIAPEDLPSVRALGGEVVTGLEAPDLRLRTLDGRELEVNSSAAPLRDRDGKIVGAVSILRDLTERRRLEREQEAARARELAVREVNQRLDTFFAMATHDLRHPVVVSKMGVEMAQRQVRQAAAGTRRASSKQVVPFVQVEQALEATARNLDRLWRLLQQLLDVTRAREGTLVLDRQVCDLAEIVRAGVEEQRLLAPNWLITLDVPGPDAPPVMVQADADRLGQVLTNYLTNAMRYSPEVQPIQVRLRVGWDGEVGVARVEVQDHGPGIAPEEIDTIWGRFQRARSVGEALGGLGLGLYIARTIVDLHGGQVGVQSRVGEGATFWFTLPLAPPAAAGGVAAGGESLPEINSTVTTS